MFIDQEEKRKKTIFYRKVHPKDIAINGLGLAVAAAYEIDIVMWCEANFHLPYATRGLESSSSSSSDCFGKSSDVKRQ